MDEGWYYGIGDNDTLGPVSFDKLVAVLRAQPDWRDVSVWCGDFDDWRKAKDVHQIAFQFGRDAQPAGPQPAPAQPSSTTRPSSTVISSKAMPAPIAPAAAPHMIDDEDAARQARNRRLLAIAAAAAALVVAVVAGVLAWQPFTPPLDRTFAQIIQQTKPVLPKKADESTSLTDVTRSGTKLVYTHVWDGPRFAIPANLGALMKSRKLAEICAAAKEIFANGGSVEYSYRSQSALFISSFEVRKEDCA